MDPYYRMQRQGSIVRENIQRLKSGLTAAMQRPESMMMILSRCGQQGGEQRHKSESAALQFLRKSSTWTYCIRYQFLHRDKNSIKIVQHHTLKVIRCSFARV